MLPRPPQQYVCWQCLGRNVISQPWHRSRLLPRAYATYVRSGKSQTYSDSGLLGRVSVRDMLRKWERENEQEKIPVNTPAMHHGSITNIEQDKSMDEIEIKDEVGIHNSMEDDLTQTRVSALTPGTLVEKTLTGQVSPILSVYVTRVGPYYLLCSVRGQISLELQPYSAFTIKGFIDPIHFQPLVKALPRDILDTYTPNTLLDLPSQQLTDHAAPIVRKLKNFVEGVDAIYREHAKTLDALLSKVSHDTKHTYSTLPQLTEQAFGDRYRRANGDYAPTALYAVHRNLITGDFGAQPLVPPSALYTNQYFYEVPPRSDLDDIKMVDEQVKKYTQFRKNVTILPDKEKERDDFLRSGGLPLVSFLVKARKLVDQSRERAARDTNGSLLPGTSGPGVTPDWSEDDLRILRVLEMWAGYEKFSPRSRLHMLGPTILRAVGRYEDTFNLSQSVGWTLLIELGWIPPWEVRARYKSMPPSVGAVRGGGFSRPTDDSNIQESLVPDFWEGRRKKWNITAFAIDSASTEFIDDAISLEPADEPNQWWLHVHVADPASQIQPDSKVAKHAETLPLTVWMPFHHTSMLPYDWVGDRFSLGKDKICLTFSSRIDEKGQIVETKVTPGILGKVVYMTPMEANRAVENGSDSNTHQETFSIGNGVGEKDPTRPLATVEELDEADRKMLMDLDALATKRKLLGLSQGATPRFPAKPQVEGSLVKSKMDNGNGNGNVKTWTVDPYIELRMSSSNQASSDYSPTVHQSMLVGCEAAARWCADRKIPIPYLSHPVPLKNVPPIVEKLKNTIYRSLSAGKNPTLQEWTNMISMIGWQTIGTKPGPFIFHGQEMYAKVTSPLRRYSDLLCHWQIHGWLKMKAEAAAAAATSDSDAQMTSVNVANLPFSSKKLDHEVIPMLRVRERLIVQATRKGNKEIALQALVRAWKLGEEVAGAPLPDKFRFEVQQYSAPRKLVKGRLNWFEVDAFFGREEIGQVVEGPAALDAQEGFPVEIPEEVPENEDEPEEGREEEEEEDEGEPDMEVRKSAADPSEGGESAFKAPGTPLRFKDLEPGDVLEVELKDVDVALQHVLVRPIQRVHVVPRKTTRPASRSVNYW